MHEIGVSDNDIERGGRFPAPQVGRDEMNRVRINRGNDCVDAGLRDPKHGRATVRRRDGEAGSCPLDRVPGGAATCVK